MILKLLVGSVSRQVIGFQASSCIQSGSGLPSAVPEIGQYDVVINGRFLTQDVTGVQRVAREFVMALDRLLGDGKIDAHVALACPRGSEFSQLGLRHIKGVHTGRFRGIIWEQLELPTIARGSLLLCLGNSAPVSSLRSGQSVALMLHDLSYIDFPKAYRPLYRTFHRTLLPLMVGRSKWIFLVSETERRSFEKRCPNAGAKVIVTPNGGWSDKVYKDTVAGDDFGTGYILYVGSLSLRKNFDRTLAAAKHLARSRGLKTVIVGSTPNVLRAPRLTIEKDIADLVLLVGQRNDAHVLASLYRNASVLLFPSLYEASPLPPAEAAYFDLPVVASNIPSMWERCGGDVFYCDPHDTSSIITAVEDALDKPELAAHMARSLKARMRNKTWDAQVLSVMSALNGDFITHTNGSTGSSKAT